MPGQANNDPHINSGDTDDQNAFAIFSLLCPHNFHVVLRIWKNIGPKFFYSGQGIKSLMNIPFPVVPEVMHCFLESASLVNRS